MADESNNKKNYGLAEIERYYSGKMPPHEMHDMEKAALEDSFLADAMEGFLHTSTPGADVADLKNKLRERQQNGRVVPMIKKKSYSQLFRVAALLLLMMGAGWLIYKISFNKKSTDISYSPETYNTESSADTTQFKEDHPPIEQQPLTRKTLEKNVNTGRAQNNITKTQSPIKETNKQIGTVDKFENDTEILKEDNATSQSVAIAHDQQALPIKQKNTQDSVQLYQRSIPMMAERQDSNLIVIGYGKKSKLDIRSNGNQVIITIKEAQDGINEVVLQKSRKDSLQKKGPSIVVEEAEPEESWSKFGEYISDHLPEDLQTDSLKGTVKVSFEINSSGEPVNLQVEKSLCEKCDAEALRLLKEGPKWKRKTKRGKVSFMF
jgi:outer membrane biosynthesis protein TonB